jgi:cytochrome c-type biogenesis protein CcmE
MAVIDPPSGASTPGPDDADHSVDPVESSDALTGSADLDLSPRALPARKRGRGWAAKIALVAILVAAGFVVSKALTSASLFFYNADEAVAKESTLGTSTFRIQGTVENDVKRTPDGADFTITYQGVEVPVDHTGDPPQLFKPGEPVVLQGHFAHTGQHLFLSDQMLVKHDATYTAKNGARLTQAEKGGKVAPKTTTTTPARSAASTQP